LISIKGIVYPYADLSGWGLLLSSMLEVFSGNVYLAVTDEQHYPWPKKAGHYGRPGCWSVQKKYFR
jgi:hypothetical protein